MGVAGAVNQFFGWHVGDPAVVVGKLVQPYLPENYLLSLFACQGRHAELLPGEQMACLAGPVYEDNVAPFLVPGTVAPGNSPPPGVFDATAILSTAFLGAGFPLDPIPKLDMFGSGPITLELRYSGGVRVEMNRRVHSESDGEPHWWDMETGEAQIDPVVGLFATLEAMPADPEWLGTVQSCTCDVFEYASMVPSHPSLAAACDKLEVLCLPYSTFEDLYPDSCESFSWTLKLNRVPIHIGFVPRTYPGEHIPAVSSPTWASPLLALPGQIPAEPFLVTTTVASVPSVRGYLASPDALVTDTTHDIVFSVSADCGHNSLAYCNALAVFNGFDGCLDMVRDLTEPQIQARVGAAISHSMEAALRPYTDFAGSVPPPCTFPEGVLDLPTATLPECNTARLTNWLAASMTHQKLDWFFSPFGTFANGSWLPVWDIDKSSDGTADGSPAHITFHFDPDPDGDNLLSWQDNCWLEPNGLYQDNQSDSDGDGIGDACDDWPCDPDDDADGDEVAVCPEVPSGICIAECEGHVDDNCPAAFNPDQKNCNDLAEEYWQAAKLGDACDPVPCPDVVVSKHHSEWEVVCPPGPCHPGECHPSCPSIPADGPSITLTCGAVSSVDLEVRPLKSHPIGPWFGEEVPPQSVNNVRTPARVCVEQIDKQIYCNQEADVNDALLTASGCWDPDPYGPDLDCSDPEKPLDRYHRITFFGFEQGNGAYPNNPARLLQYTLPHTALEPQETWSWNVALDHVRWVTDTTPALIDEAPTPDDMRVGIWTHASTVVGQQHVSGYLTGVHVATEPKLANHYALGNGREPLRLRPGDDNGCLKCAAPFDIPTPADAGIQGSGAEAQGAQSATIAPPYAPYLAFRPPLEPVEEGFSRYGATRFEASYLVRLADGKIGALTGSHTCAAEDVTPALGPAALQHFLGGGLVWAHDADPFIDLGSGSTFPLAVMLNEEGGEQILDSVISDGKSLLASGDHEACSFDTVKCGECPSRLCNPDSSCCDLPCTSGADCPTGYCDMELGGICGYPLRSGSPHVRDYVAVLSRSARGVFVVGGTDIDTGEARGEIWFSRLSADDWKPVPAPFGLGQPLAATYSFASGELLVLDLVDGTVRLWAVHTRTFLARELGSWPHHPAWDRHWLVTDRDGGVLLATARSTTQLEATLPKNKSGKTLLCHFPPDDLGAARTLSVGANAADAHLAHGDTPGVCKGWALARFDIRGGASTLDGIASGPEPLWLPPLVDGDGYGFAHYHPASGEPSYRRSYELGLVPASLAEVGWRL